MPTGNNPDRSDPRKHWSQPPKSKKGKAKDKAANVFADIRDAYMDDKISHNKMATMMKSLKAAKEGVDKALLAADDAVREIQSELYSAQR